MHANSVTSSVEETSFNPRENGVAGSVAQAVFNLDIGQIFNHVVTILHEAKSQQHETGYNYLKFSILDR